MKKVYVAGKLNDDAVGYIKNCHRMIMAAKDLRDYGFAVYVPAIDFLEGLVHGDFEYSDYFENSQEWLAVSDAMFLTPGWETSKGTAKEIEYAQSLGIPIFEYLDEIIEWRNAS